MRTELASPPTRRWSPGRSVRTVLPLVATAAVLIGAWIGAVRILDVPTYLLPAPGDVFGELVENYSVYLRHGRVTLVESMAGFAIGSTIGFVLAVLLSTSRVLERSLMPYLIMATNIPIVAFAPVVVIYAGFGMASKIIVAAFLTFFPVVINTLKGLKSADRVHSDLFRMMSATRLQELLRLRLPTALPFIFAALKLAATASVLAAVVAEFIQATEGIGWLILTSAYINDMTRVWATVIVSSMIAVGFYLVVVAVERRLVPWHSSVADLDR
jgi:NitT/TauT family transport system permease protein